MAETQDQNSRNQSQFISSSLIADAIQVNRLDLTELNEGSLPDSLVAEAEYDLHEKKEWIDRDVEAIREMVLAEPGLNSKTDRAFLLSFLRARKFDYEKAMTMIRGYYGVRRDNAELFVSLLPSSLKHVWLQNMQTVLTKPDHLGRTVLIFSTVNWNVETVSLDDIFRAQVLLLEHIVRLPVTQLRGINAVVDCSGLSFNHAYYITPIHIKRMVSIIQDVFPLRFKALHFVRGPSIFDWIFSLIKPFLSDTLKGRLHFHGENIEELLEDIPREILPNELGGNAGPLNNSYLVNKLLEHEDYFKDHFSYGYEVSKNPSEREQSPSQNTVLDTVAGVGSFIGSYYRKMCIE